MNNIKNITNVTNTKSVSIDEAIEVDYNRINEQSTAEVIKKKRGGDNGKRKPIVDEYGSRWCNCTRPNLTSHCGVGRGQALCLKCGNYWYH